MGQGHTPKSGHSISGGIQRQTRRGDGGPGEKEEDHHVLKLQGKRQKRGVRHKLLAEVCDDGAQVPRGQDHPADLLQRRVLVRDNLWLCRDSQELRECDQEGMHNCMLQDTALG